MEKPKRIQRKRIKGWKMPENTVSVCLPGKWGNPYKLMGDMVYIDAKYRRRFLNRWVIYPFGNKQEDVVYLFRELFKEKEHHENDSLHWARHFQNIDLSELKGKNLACFCKEGTLCHADVLLELANK